MFFGRDVGVTIFIAFVQRAAFVEYSRRRRIAREEIDHAHALFTLTRTDARIGFEFLKPGPGWGGSCFPKDSRALVKIGEEAGFDFALLRGVIDVNEQQYERVVEKIRRLGGVTIAERVITWGKRGDEHARRLAASFLMPGFRRIEGKRQTVLNRLFDDVYLAAENLG